MFSQAQFQSLDRHAYAAGGQLPARIDDGYRLAYPLDTYAYVDDNEKRRRAQIDLDVNLPYQYGSLCTQEERLRVARRYYNDGATSQLFQAGARSGAGGGQVSVGVSGMGGAFQYLQQIHVNGQPSASYAPSTDFAAPSPSHAQPVAVPADRVYTAHAQGQHPSHGDVEPSHGDVDPSHGDAQPSPSREYGTPYVIHHHLPHGLKQEPDDQPIAAISWPQEHEREDVEQEAVAMFPDGSGFLQDGLGVVILVEDGRYVRVDPVDPQYADVGYDYDYDDTGPIPASPLSDTALGHGAGASEERDVSFSFSASAHPHPPPSLQPHRSYTLAAAMTPIEPKHEVPVPRSASLPLDASPPAPAAPSSSIAVDPAPAVVSPAPRPRGRPRKQPVSQLLLQQQQQPRSVGYPYPAPLSLDELPLPDRDGKPGQALFRLTTTGAPPEPPKKKPVMACLFCRERKIACGPPVPGSAEQRCNQCARRSLRCEYPKESRRGQHKRGPRAARVQALAEARSSSETLPLPAPEADAFAEAVPMDLEWSPVRSTA